MSRSTAPSSHAVRRGLVACAQAPSAAPAPPSLAKLRARVLAQLVQLLSQMALR